MDWSRLEEDSHHGREAHMFETAVNLWGHCPFTILPSIHCRAMPVLLGILRETRCESFGLRFYDTTIHLLIHGRRVSERAEVGQCV